MKNYTAQDIENWLHQSGAQFTHSIVAHTPIRTYEKSLHRLGNARISVSNKLGKTLRMFYKSLYTGAARRLVNENSHMHLYRPDTFVTIEGATAVNFHDPSQTIHCNITLGHLPRDFGAEELAEKFATCWYLQGKNGGTHVKAFVLDPARGDHDWIGYTLKECQKNPNMAWDELGCWDVTNCYLRPKNR
jgi:hypothetical protein